jgi:hypothetical protein
VGGGPYGGIAWGRYEFKIVFRKGVRVAARRGRAPGLLPTLLPNIGRAFNSQCTFVRANEATIGPTGVRQTRYPMLVLGGR